MAAKDVKPETKPAVDDGEELIEVNYPEVPGTHYSGDIFASVNGENILVKRGETVRIPKKFKEVIDYANSEDQKTAKKLAELEAKK
jgi:hypothetical protein